MEILFAGLLTFYFVISAITFQVANLSHLLAFTALLLGMAIIYKKEIKISIPPHFPLMVMFNVVLLVYWIAFNFNSNHLNYLLLFIEGMAAWFVVYNLGNKLTKNIQLMFLLPFLFYALILFVSQIFQNRMLLLGDLFFQTTSSVSHTQIGNLAAIVFVYFLANTQNNFYKIWDIAFYLIAVFFELYSKSRTALVAIFTALILNKYPNNIVNKLKPLVFIAVIILILFTTQGRSVIFSRVYFIQGVSNLFSHPLGVGMGNFREISLEFYKTGGILGSYSGSAHNIFLEALSGVGLLSIPFLIFGFNIFKSVLSKKSFKSWNMVFITLSVIFFLDLTYTIPGMFMLWFISLAKSQLEESEV